MGSRRKTLPNQNPSRHGPFKDSLDLHLQWHYMVQFDTESDAIQVCGTYDRVGFYVILYVSDTVMCMVLYDTVSECGISHIFTSKGRGEWLYKTVQLCLFY